jgi:uncharacterized protein (DUF433 family)
VSATNARSENVVIKMYVELDSGGTYRVGGYRTTLDFIVYEYLHTGSADRVVKRFPDTGEENVYGALAFYLANKDEVHEYLKRREAEADQLRAQVEALPKSPAIERLRAIKAAKQNQP